MTNGRFGQGVVITQIVSPKDIIKQPEIPPRRFGLSRSVAEARQQRAFELRRIRKEAITEGQRLESEYFSRAGTIQQIETGFTQVSPFVQPFIRTTPQVAKQKQQETIKRLEERIQKAKATAKRLESGTNTEQLRAQRELDVASELESIRTRVVGGEIIGFGEAESFAVSKAEARTILAERRVEAKEIAAKQPKEAVEEDKPIIIESYDVPAQRLDPVRVIDTSKGPIIIKGKKAFEKSGTEIVKKTFPQPKEITFKEIIKSEKSLSGKISDITIKAGEKILTGEAIPSFKIVKGGVEKKKISLFDEEEIIAGREERTLEQTQQTEIERLNKEIEKATVGKTKEGIPIVSEEKYGEFQVEAGILEAREVRLRKLESERLQKPISKTTRLAQTLAKGTEPRKEDIFIPALYLFKRREKGIEFIGKQVEKIETKVRAKGQFLKKADSKEPAFTVEQTGKIAKTGVELGLIATPVLGEIIIGEELIKSTAIATDPTKKFEERIAAGTTGLLSAGFLGAVGGRRILRAGKKEVRVKLLSKDPFSKAFTKINVFKAGEKITKTEAQFRIITKVPPQRFFVTTKKEVFVKRILGPDTRFPSQLTELELKTAFKGEIKLTPPTITRVSTTKLKIKEGLIQDDAFLFTQKATPKRIEPIKISRLKGKTELKEIDITRVRREGLDVLTTKSLEELEVIKDLPKGITGKFEFKKGTKLSKGQILTEDLLKLTKKDIKIIPIGRRTTRGDITFLTKKVVEQEFPREVGLVRKEIFVERVKGVDITFPRFKKPKKALPEIKGVTEIKEFRLPPEPESFIVKRPTGVSLEKLRRDLQLQKQIQQIEPIKQQVIKTVSIPKTATIPTVKLKTATVPKVTLKSEAALKIQTKVAPSIKLQPALKEAIILKTIPRPLTKQVTKSITKQISKPVTRQIPRTTVRQVPRLLTKTTTKLVTKQITKQSVKATSVTTPRLPRPKPVVKIAPVIPFRFKVKPKKKRRRKEEYFKSDIALVQGFTARTLKLPPLIIPKAKLPQAAVKFQTIGLRPLPLLKGGIN